MTRDILPNQPPHICILSRSCMYYPWRPGRHGVTLGAPVSYRDACRPSGDEVTQTPLIGQCGGPSTSSSNLISSLANSSLREKGML